MMRLNRLTRSLAAAAALVLLSAVSLAAAETVTLQDVQYLEENSPTLEQAGSHAVVWQRTVHFLTDEDGRAVKDVRLIVLADSSMPFDWLQNQLIVPAGGELVVDQATCFDLESSAGTQEDIPLRSGAEQGGVAWMNWPHWVDGTRVIVLSYRQIGPAGRPASGMVWLGEPYPVREGEIAIRLSTDQELYYNSSLGQSPAISDEKPYFWYRWYYAQQPARRGSYGLIDRSDPYLVLSLTSGTNRIAEAMQSAESQPAENLPGAIRPFSASDTPQQIVQELDAAWKDSRIHMSGAEVARDPKDRQFPLTDPEMAAAACARLRQGGFDAHIWWQSPMGIQKDMPDAPEVLYRPALSVKAPGQSKAWFYFPGGTSDPGRQPEALDGRYLFGVKSSAKPKGKSSGKVIPRYMKAGSFVNMRLTAVWDLNAQNDGTVSGTATFIVRRPWPSIVFPNGAAKNGLQNFSSLGDWYHGTPLDISTEPDGSVKVKFAVSKKSAVPAEKGLMVSLPSLELPAFDQLRALSGQVGLKFPFVMEQSYTVKIPGKMHPMVLPNRGSQVLPGAEYSVTQRFNRVQNAVTSQEKIIVKTTEVDSSWAEQFYKLLGLWGLWKNNSLALVL